MTRPVQKSSALTANGVLFGIALATLLFSTSSIFGVPEWVPQMICSAVMLPLALMVARRTWKSVRS